MKKVPMAQNDIEVKVNRLQEGREDRYQKTIGNKETVAMQKIRTPRITKEYNYFGVLTKNNKKYLKVGSTHYPTERWRSYARDQHVSAFHYLYIEEGSLLDETYIHNQLKQWLAKGYKEWYYPTPECLQYIKDVFGVTWSATPICTMNAKGINSLIAQCLAKTEVVCGIK